MKTFKDKVLAVVKKIPKGSVLTYKEVAQKSGNEKASRVVGNILAQNTDKNIPCYRVIRSDKKIGNYNGLHTKGIKGEQSKKELLKKEGFNC